MRTFIVFFVMATAPLVQRSVAQAAEPARPELGGRFRDVVRPFLKTFCLECHSGEKPKADLDLAPYSTLDAVEKDSRQWAKVLEKLKAEEMPPEEAKQHPTDEIGRAHV